MQILIVIHRRNELRWSFKGVEDGFWGPFWYPIKYCIVISRQVSQLPDAFGITQLFRNATTINVAVALFKLISNRNDNLNYQSCVYTSSPTLVIRIFSYIETVFSHYMHMQIHLCCKSVFWERPDTSCDIKQFISHIAVGAGEHVIADITSFLFHNAITEEVNVIAVRQTIELPLVIRTQSTAQDLCTRFPFCHDDVIKWKPFPRHWASVPHKGRWREALRFSLFCAWTNGWANTRDADDLRRHRDHYDVTERWCFCVVTGCLHSHPSTWANIR